MEATSPRSPSGHSVNASESQEDLFSDELFSALGLERHRVHSNCAIVLVAGYSENYDIHTHIVEILDENRRDSLGDSNYSTNDITLFAYKFISLSSSGITQENDFKDVDIYLIRGPSFLARSLIKEGFINELVCDQKKSIKSSTRFVFVIVLDWKRPEYMYNELKTLLELAENCRKLYEGESYPYNSCESLIRPFSIVVCACNSEEIRSFTHDGSRNLEKLDIILMALRIYCLEYSATLLHLSPESPESLKLLKMLLLNAILTNRYPKEEFLTTNSTLFDIGSNSICMPHIPDTVEKIRDSALHMNKPLREAVDNCGDKHLLEDLLNNECLSSQIIFELPEFLLKDKTVTCSNNENSQFIEIYTTGVAQVPKKKLHLSPRFTMMNSSNIGELSSDVETLGKVYQKRLGDSEKQDDISVLEDLSLRVAVKCGNDKVAPSEIGAISTLSKFGEKPAYKPGHNSQTAASFFRSLLANKKKNPK